MAIPALIAHRLKPSSYARRIGAGLTKAYERADERPVDVAAVKAAIFSDHHRGKGDGADDFRRCEQAYAAALGWYLEEGYELWLLGDVEELWENSAKPVMERYEGLLKLEGEFGDRLWRFYGNHDMEWKREKDVRARLHPHAPGVRVREGLKVVLTDDGRPLVTVFLVHGHQGTVDSGNALVMPIARAVVRLVWATFQRKKGFANTSPATDAVLRGKHDRAMAAWADKHPERVVLIAGHTHSPVFPGTLPPDRRVEADEAEAAYEAAKGSGEGLAAARAARELASARALRQEEYEPLPLDRPPSYFNTGCCSFGDGDVTALELSGGKVRLVRWLDNNGKPAAHELATGDLRTICGKLTGEAPSLS